MKKGLSKAAITLTSVLVISSTVTAFGAAPRDIQRHWAFTEINTLMELGLINGYPDLRFKPDRTMTREEVCIVISNALKNENSPIDNLQVGVQAEAKVGGEIIENNMFPSLPSVSFSDMDGRWSEQQVEYLAGQGIISGYPDGEFKPKNILTREEFAKIIFALNELKGIEETVEDQNDEATEKEEAMKDISRSYARDEIKYLDEQDIMNGYEDGTFRPEKGVTRAEAATVLCRLQGYEPIQGEVTLPTYKVIDVPYISQVYPVTAYVGCEGTSLLMGLQAKGYAADVGLRQFLDDMPKHPSNPEKGFAGSPYTPDKTKKVRTTIFPAKLSEYGDGYGKVSNFSGSSVSELRAELLAGNPVVAYVTMNWEKPFYRMYDVEGIQKKFLSNNHVVLVCGYNSENNSYYISDPYNIDNKTEEYKYWIDGNIFEPIYNERRHAVVVE